MDDEELVRTDIELAVADAHWRHELAQQHGVSMTEKDYTPAEMKGEPGTMLRAAFNERSRAITAWRQRRGIA